MRPFLGPVGGAIQLAPRLERTAAKWIPNFDSQPAPRSADREGDPMKNVRRLALLVLMLGLFAPLAARAIVLWDWEFAETIYVVGQSESIFVEALLTCDPSSTDNLQIEGAGATFTGELQKTYSFTPGDLGDLLGLNLRPGQTVSFFWGLLTPIGGRVAPGIYPADPALLSLTFPGTGTPEQSPLNTFLIRVVPEPPPIVLLLAVILAAGAQARRNAAGRV